MTKTEFLQVLLDEEVRFYRVNGFSLKYDGCCLVKGRIPLKLARKIREGVDTKKLDISFGGGGDPPEEWATNCELADMVSEAIRNMGTNPKAIEMCNEKQAEYIRQAEQNGTLDSIYILAISVYTTSGLKHIIRTIRESGFMNECLYDA